MLEPNRWKLLSSHPAVSRVLGSRASGTEGSLSGQRPTDTSSVSPGKPAGPGSPALQKQAAALVACQPAEVLWLSVPLGVAVPCDPLRSPPSSLCSPVISLRNAPDCLKMVQV